MPSDDTMFVVQQLIEKASLPIGMLSEEAAEARNKQECTEITLDENFQAWNAILTSCIDFSL